MEIKVPKPFKKYAKSFLLESPRAEQIEYIKAGIPKNILPTKIFSTDHIIRKVAILHILFYLKFIIFTFINNEIEKIFFFYLVIYMLE